MKKRITVIVGLIVGGYAMATSGSIQFTGRVLAPSCTASIDIGTTLPSMACHYTQPPRVTVQHRPEPQLLLTPDDTVYVLTYD